LTITIDKLIKIYNDSGINDLLTEDAWNHIGAAVFIRLLVLDRQVLRDGHEYNAKAVLYGHISEGPRDHES
jgi:hypothetical protein